MRSYQASRLQKANSVRASAHAEVLGVIAELAESEEWRGDGAPDLGAWVASVCQESVKTARGWVREAQSLVARPALRCALENGEVSVSQTKALCVLAREGTDDDELWLEALPTWPISELEREARKQIARELERKDGGTFFRLEHTRDERFMRGEFQLHPEDGAIVLSAIEARIPKGTQLRDWDRASADALVALAKGSGAVRMQKATVLFARDGDVAELNSGGFVGARTAERLACCGRVQQVELDGHGNIVATQPNSDVIPSATMRALHARDHGQCTFPSCDHDKLLEAHHLKWRINGGSNDLGNLQLTCLQHHKLVHEGRWSLGDRAGHANTWYRPDGSVLDPFDTS